MNLVDKLTDPVRTWTMEWRNYLAKHPWVRGSESLSLLKQHASTKRGKLSPADRERLATALYFEIERLSVASQAKQPFSKAAWMQAAGFDDPGNPTKRLNEYVQGPWYSLEHETWEARSKKLGANAFHYACLIEALFQFTDEERDHMCQRIFAGSSFAGSVVDAERYRNAAGQLQDLVRAIDLLAAQTIGQEGLRVLFARTAEAKSRMLGAGELFASWPFYDGFYGPGSIIELSDLYWDDRDSPETTESPLGLSSLAWNPNDPRYRYMMRMPLDWLDGLVYLPRAYLGCVACLPDWVKDPDSEVEQVGRYLAQQYQYQCTLVERYELSTRRTRVQVVHEVALQEGPLTADMEVPLQQSRYPAEEGHCWLVIYPSKDRSGLCPLLYWALGDAGVHVCPLDAHSIHALSHFHVATDFGVVTLFERIEQMLADPCRPLAREWIRTALDLCSNPILAKERLMQ